jgi:hypothetical protein
MPASETQMSDRVDSESSMDSNLFRNVEQEAVVSYGIEGFAQRKNVRLPAVLRQILTELQRPQYAAASTFGRIVIRHHQNFSLQ